MIEEVCRQLGEWRDDGLDFTVSVNVSYRQLSKEFSPWVVSSILKEYGVRGEWLTLEITEGLLMDDSPEVMEWLNGFKSLGISLSIDDFGTGYSSFSYLEEGQFASGSMGPKVKAAIEFVETGRGETIITEALQLKYEECGTRIVKEPEIVDN